MHSSIAHTDLPPQQPPFVPPLDIAREQAHKVLAEAKALDMEIATSFQLAWQFGGVCEVLRQVLAALDAEDGGRHA